MREDWKRAIWFDGEMWAGKIRKLGTSALRKSNFPINSGKAPDPGTVNTLRPSFSLARGIYALKNRSLSLATRVILVAGSDDPLLIREKEELYNPVCPCHILGIERGEAW